MSPRTRTQSSKNGALDPNDLASRISRLLTELQQVNERLLEEAFERKKAEAAVREREQTIRALLNAPKEMALLIDRKGTILAANETALRRLSAHAKATLGKHATDLVGCSVFDIFPPEIAEARKDRNAKVLRTG
ncbi:MAG: hypothetical protein ACE5FA_05265 [Dehalococcoidia bacterium]